MAGVQICCVLALALVWNSCATPGGYTLREHRAFINGLCHETLRELYSRRPEARANIERAPGYAVFRQSGLRVPLPGTGDGYGVAVDNSNGKRPPRISSKFSRATKTSGRPTICSSKERRACSR